MRLVPSSYTDVDESTQRCTRRRESLYSYEMCSSEMQSSFKVGGFVHNALKGKHERLYCLLLKLPLSSSDICLDIMLHHGDIRNYEKLIAESLFNFFLEI
jgi:hypothetical protein